MRSASGMYNLAGYAQMLADRVRCMAYAQALDAVITPGCSVLEIGSGPGVFALHAARAGAGTVYALEPSDAVTLGPELATRTGYGERITFLQTTSQAFEAPAPFDVVFSDLRGILPLFQHHIPSIVDARQRLLAPGGTLIPARDVLRAAVVTAEDAYAERASVWQQGALGFELDAGWDLEQHRPSKVVLAAEACLTPCATLATFDYTTLTDTDIATQTAWSVERSATAHGVAVWFDSELCPGIGFSCAPGDRGLIYGQMFFPWPRPVALRGGDTVELRLEGHLAGGDYVWRWRTRIARDDQARGRFDQGSFWAAPLSLANLQRRSADHCPTLGDEAARMAFVFARMRGDTTLASIADALWDRFPEAYDDRRSAFDQVCSWSVRYGG